MAKQKTNTQNPEAERFKKLADYVQQTRRNRKLSVRKVAQMSNLPESTVRALENPRKSTLPKSNVIGLYKVYASTLEIPASRVTKMAGKDNDEKPEFSLKRLPKLKSLVVFSNIGTTIAVAIVFVIVLSYAAWQGFGLISSPDLIVEFPTQEFIVVDESQIEVRGSAQRESTVLVNGEPTTVSSESGEFQETVYLQRGYNYITVEVVNSFSSSTIKNYLVIYQPNTLPA